MGRVPKIEENSGLQLLRLTTEIYETPFLKHAAVARGATATEQSVVFSLSFFLNNRLRPCAQPIVQPLEHVPPGK
jgi:hypothetical protein